MKHSFCSKANVACLVVRFCTHKGPGPRAYSNRVSSSLASGPQHSCTSVNKENLRLTSTSSNISIKGRENTRSMSNGSSGVLFVFPICIRYEFRLILASHCVKFRDKNRLHSLPITSIFQSERFLQSYLLSPLYSWYNHLREPNYRIITIIVNHRFINTQQNDCVYENTSGIDSFVFNFTVFKSQ